MALSSANVGKYEFLTEGLSEKGLLEKAATIKKIKYLQLGSELEKQTDTAKKQYQGLDKVYKFDKENYLKNLADQTKSKKTTT